MVDFVVTAIGGQQSARAILKGGGLLGLRSSENVPAGIDDDQIEFVDWPFMLEDPNLDEHIEVVERHRPKIAVAPDIDGRHPLGDVIEIGDTLLEYAQHVIVVPKVVDVDQVPDRFRLGIPFRNEWETETGGQNRFIDFRGRPVHILGGNPTEQLKLADRFKLDVRSVDSPNLLSWATNGRVWIARLGGANDLIDQETGKPEEWTRLLEDEALATMGLPTFQQMTDSANPRFHRIVFSIMNLRQAWDSRSVELTRAVEPGRGPHPVPPKGSGLLGPAETFEEREEMRERFMDATITDEVGRIQTERSPELFGDDELNERRKRRGE